MKKFLFCLLALCLANIPATLHAATPVPPMDSVIIENFTPQEIQRVIAMYVPNWGWCPEEANEFKMTFSRKETDIGASILFGSRFNSTPESRVTFYFSYTETGKIRVDASHSVATNPGSAYEYESAGERNSGSIPRLLLKHLEAIFNGTDGVGLDAMPTKHGYTVFKVFDGSPAEKAGIKKGDIITKINGTKIGTVSVLRVLHVHFWGEPGHTISLDIKDNSKSREITLGHIPPQKKLLATLFPDKNIPIPSPQVETEVAPKEAERKEEATLEISGESETDKRLQEMFDKYSSKE